MTSTALQTLRLSGNDPFGWGRQHGAALGTQIQSLADIRTQLLNANLRWPKSALDQLCNDQLAAMSQRWPRVLAELKGISAGSGVGLQALVILNGYTDLRDFTREDESTEDSGCSIIAAQGPQVNFVAQTWDMHASAEPFTVLLELSDAPQPARILTVAGCVGLNGVNAAGVSVMINTLLSRETNRHGLLWPGLIRLMLEQPTALLAKKCLQDNLSSGGRNFVVADRGQAFDFETTGRRVEELGSVGMDRPGYLVHTNHYLGSLKDTEFTDRLGATTHARLNALQAFVADRPISKITSDEARRGFFESGSLCDCVNLVPKDDPHAAATCGGLGVDHISRKAFAFRGRYSPASTVEWSLDL
jgi:isopenicillin-N N-acyltransferase-like protein